jgi:hypothetical protein
MALMLSLAWAAEPSGAGRAQEPASGAMAAPAPDYAPSGMPDFGQCRGAWSLPGSPAQWTHAGPVALADALWWLDSVAETEPAPPPAVSDTHALVTAYPVFGPALDDHDAQNLTPLVTDLSLRADTNGGGWRGTRWQDLVDAAGDYVGSRRAVVRYETAAVDAPGPGWLADMMGQGAAVVVALGVWEDRGAAGWQRIGGHYAAVAGLDASGGWLWLSDPLADSAAYGGGGLAVPQDPARHSCREAPREHDDARVVSHDAYRLAAAGDGAGSALGDRLVLEDYFDAQTYNDAAAFAGQNPWAAGEAVLRWGGSAVVMALDGALAVVPAGDAERSTATSTEAAVGATGTATATETRTATESRTATETATAPASAWPTPAASPDGPASSGRAMVPLAIR